MDSVVMNPAESAFWLLMAFLLGGIMGGLLMSCDDDMPDGEV